MKTSTKTRPIPKASGSSSSTMKPSVTRGKAVAPISRTTRRTAAPTTSAEDDISERLKHLDIKSKSKLRVQDVTKTIHELRLQTMRKVNSASQALSRSMVAKEKETRTTKGKEPAPDVVHSSQEALKGLTWLRAHQPEERNLDIERAAVSVLSKLVSLELYTFALEACRSIHPSLCAFHSVNPPIIDDEILSLLAIPLPESRIQDHSTLDTLTLTYLLQILAIVLSLNSGPKKITTFHASQLVAALTPFPLLVWANNIQEYQPCDTNMVSQVLTRAYTTLLRASTPPQASAPFGKGNDEMNPRDSFALRVMALHCLLAVPPDSSESDHNNGLKNKVWEQAVHFGSSFISVVSKNSNSNDIHLAMRFINEEYSRLYSHGTGEGKSWHEFLQCWSGVARKAGDIANVRRIAGLVSPDSSPAGDSEITNEEDDTLKLDNEGACLHFCSFLAEVETILSSGDAADSSIIGTLTQQLRRIVEIRHDRNVLFHEKDDSPNWERQARRYFERLRRTTVTAMSSCPAALELGEACTSILVVRLRNSRCNASLSSLLDTYFNLARNSFITHNVYSWDTSFQWLKRAGDILGISIESSTDSTIDIDETIDKSSFALVLYATLHNLASKLYNEGEYAGAVKFLNGGCIVGRMALQWRSSATSTPDTSDQGWTQLEGQLWKRWELLGVCLTKINDRKGAYSAFRDALHDYPEDRGGTVKGIVERLTMMGTDLRIPTSQISVSNVFTSLPPPSWEGHLLKIQLEFFLQPGRRHKSLTRSVLPLIFARALDCYTASSFPLQRAAILLSISEWTYYSSTFKISLPPPYEEALSLLGVCDSEHSNTDILGSVTECRALAGIWGILLTHMAQESRSDLPVSGTIGDLASGIIVALQRRLSKPISPILAKTTSPNPAKNAARTVVRTTRNANPSGPPPAPRKNRVRGIPPKIIKSPPRKALKHISLNSPDSSKRSLTEQKKPVDFLGMAWNDVEKLISLLQHVACILRVHGHLKQRIEILEIITRICEKTWGVINDALLLSSIELAQEYLRIGAIKKTEEIYSRLGPKMKDGLTDDGTSAMFWLSYSEFMAKKEDVLRSSSMYCEALKYGNRLAHDDRTLDSYQRITLRSERLELSAFACRVFAAIQALRGDTASAITASLQSLRLWNRAVSNLGRITPQGNASKPSEGDPFSMTGLREALPSDSTTENAEPMAEAREISPRSSLNGIQWRIALGLMDCLVVLVRLYSQRGSPREAQHFVDQCLGLAESLNSSVDTSMAMTARAEIQAFQGLLPECEETLNTALSSLPHDSPRPTTPSIHVAEVKRLFGHLRSRCEDDESAKKAFQEALSILDELSVQLLSASPSNCPASTPTPLLAQFFTWVLKEHIWLLRDEENEDSIALLNRFISLPATGIAQAEANALLARLTLHNVYSLCQSDMVLNSIAESTISLPMGTSNPIDIMPPTSIQQITATLENAEKLFWQSLSAMIARGDIPTLRSSAMSLALVTTLKTSMGAAEDSAPFIATNLLDRSISMTIRRELLEAIPQKYPPSFSDDTSWPKLTPNGTPLSDTDTSKGTSINWDASEDEDDKVEGRTMKAYWQYVRHKYQNQTFDPLTASEPLTKDLPTNWTVVHIAVAEDKNTLLISRQRGGDSQSPLVFCVPLRGRRDEDEEENHLTFHDALSEFGEIVRLSDETAKAAKDIPRDDKEARTAWWRERTTLDLRLRELLENVEFCWLGAFKTILSPKSTASAQDLIELRHRFHQVFQINLRWKDKKPKAQPSHQRAGSLSQSLTDVKLDDSLVECFSTLAPDCRDEELEDLVYFILDLYQYHGVSIAISEVDITQVVVDLRSVLEDYTTKRTASQPPSHRKGTPIIDPNEHTFLILDKNVQGLPWESIPMLRGRSVSRIPTVDFLLDRMKLGAMSNQDFSTGNFSINPRNGCCLLNPSGDLDGTEHRFRNWARDMKASGWDSLVGQAPTEQQFLEALRDKDLVIYFGHGSGEQYVRSHKIRSLSKCAAVMLWGCSSGLMKEMGDYDRVGTPNHYMIAGCPSLVANLWDVTDRDIDKLTQSVLDKLNLHESGLKKKPSSSNISLPAAVAQSRDVCKLKYLTGAATVVYGVPWHC